MATEATDEVPPNTILEVLQKGYFLNDRLIRPAFVKVAVRKPDPERRPSVDAGRGGKPSTRPASS